MSERRSNFEYLRIISILMIIAFHCVFHGSAVVDTSVFPRKVLWDVVYHFGELGVSCFFLISGYFLTDTKFKVRKLVLLLLEIEFYVIVSRLLLVAFNQPAQWSLRDFFPIINDEYWFIHVYLLVYILQPGLKRMLPAVGQKTLLWLLASQILIWSVLPTVFLVPLFHLNNTEAMPYYNRYIWFVVVYLIGYYIRAYGIPKPQKDVLHLKDAPKWQVILFPFELLILAILIGELGVTPINAIYFWPPNSTLMLMMSVALFCAFKDRKPKHSPKWVMYIATCTLGIYLLHDGALRPFLWKNLLVFQPNGSYALYLIKCVVLVFSAGILVESLRKLMERFCIVPLLDRLRRNRERRNPV